MRSLYFVLFILLGLGYADEASIVPALAECLQAAPIAMSPVESGCDRRAVSEKIGGGGLLAALAKLPVVQGFPLGVEIAIAPVGKNRTQSWQLLCYPSSEANRRSPLI